MRPWARGSLAAHRDAIAGVRNRLIAEHWGLEPKTVERALASGKPVVGRRSRRRSVAGPGSRARVKRERARDVAACRTRGSRSASEILIELGDPESVVTAERIVQRLDPVRGRPLLKWTLGMTAAVVLVLAAVALLRYLPSGGSGFVERATSALAALRGSPWGVPARTARFRGRQRRVVPDTRADRRDRGRARSLARLRCAAFGTLMAASITFSLGRTIGRRPLRRWLGRRAQLLERQLERRGIVAVALIRKVPIVPFTLVNMLIGASGLTYRDFIVGTAIGMLPGIAVFAIVGGRAAELWTNPTALECRARDRSRLALDRASSSACSG